MTFGDLQAMPGPLRLRHFAKAIQNAAPRYAKTLTDRADALELKRASQHLGRKTK